MTKQEWKKFIIINTVFYVLLITKTILLTMLFFCPSGGNTTFCGAVGSNSQGISEGLFLISCISVILLSALALISVWRYLSKKINIKTLPKAEKIGYIFLCPLWNLLFPLIPIIIGTVLLSKCVNKSKKTK